MGNGLADILFGDVNPSGYLPLSLPIHNYIGQWVLHRGHVDCVSQAAVVRK